MKNRKLLFALMICFPIVFGLVIMTFPRLWNFEGSSGEWLGYWGGIIGSLLGVIGALLVFNIQLEDEKNQRSLDDKRRSVEQNEEKERIRIEQVDNTFFNLLDLHNKLKEKLEGREEYCDEIFDSLKNELQNKENETIKERRLNYFKQNKEDVIRRIDKNVKYADENILNEILNSLNQDNYRMIEEVFLKQKIDDHIIENEYHSIDHDLIHNINNNQDPGEQYNEEGSLYELTRYNSFFKLILLNEIKTLISQDSNLLNFSNKLKEFGNIVSFTNEDRVNVVTAAYSSQYFIYGNYFRIFHRVVKYVNENVKDIDSKKNYIGFLRAMINEKEMLVIFYNAFYTPRGKGLKEQLKKTNFFGDIKDLNVKGDYTQHFDKSLLLWEDEDLKLIKECELIIDNKI